MSEEFTIKEHSPALPAIARFIDSLYHETFAAYMDLNKLEEGEVLVVGWNGNGTVIGKVEDPYKEGGQGITFREKEGVIKARIILLGIDQTLMIDRGPLLDILYALGDKV